MTSPVKAPSAYLYRSTRQISLSSLLTAATEAHDHDGLPHTLEHLVFMGSEKYPYKVCSLAPPSFPPSPLLSLYFFLFISPSCFPMPTQPLPLYIYLLTFSTSPHCAPSPSLHSILET